MKDDDNSQAYWKATLGLLTRILFIWFAVSFGAGILFADLLNNIMLGGYTQVAQYIVLILACTVPAIFISLQLTGNPIPQLGLGGSYVGSDMTLLQKLDSVVTELGFG